MDKIYDLLVNHKKTIVISVVVLAAAFAIAAAISSLVGYLTKPALLEVYVLPKTAKVTVNGSEYNNGIYELPAGDYSAEIKAEGYEAKTVEFSIKAHETTKLADYLKCSGGGFECYKAHPAEIEALRDARFDQESYEFARDYTDAKDVVTKDPIFSYTPYESYEKGIKVRAEEVTNENYKEGAKVKVHVSLMTCMENSTNGLKNNFIAWLEARGMKASDYDISYVYCDGSKRL